MNYDLEQLLNPTNFLLSLIIFLALLMILISNNSFPRSY